MVRTVMAMNLKGFLLSSPDRYYPIPFYTIKTT